MHILRGFSIEPLPYYEVINIINGNTSVPLSQAALNMTAGFRNCGGIQVANLHNPLFLKLHPSRRAMKNPYYFLLEALMLAVRPLVPECLNSLSSLL